MFESRLSMSIIFSESKVYIILYSWTFYMCKEFLEGAVFNNIKVWIIENKFPI